MDAYIDYLENKALKHLVVDATGRTPIDYVDMVKSADYYVGSWLTAKQPVDVYSSASLSGTKIKTILPGDIVGRIYSYVQKDGKVFWQLEGSSGNGTGGFVVHGPGKFDTSIALDTASGKTHEELMLDLKSDPITKVTEGIGKVATGVGDAVGGIGKSLSLVGDNLIWIILAVVIFLVATSYAKFKTV